MTTQTPTLDRSPVRGHPAIPLPAEELLRQRDALPLGDPGRVVLRNRVIEANLPLAGSLARRYAGRGERLEDLTQAAAVALIRAVDGYDPSRLIPFVGYAVPCIVGALKRHFRDSAWAMRVPRSIQELTRQLTAAGDELSQRQGRAPSTVELAEHLRVTVADVHTAAGARHAYRLASLNGTVGEPDVEAFVGRTDPHYSTVEDRITLAPLLAALAPRQQRILALRFAGEMTQAQIAAAVGVSQMQVSRLLRQTLDQMKVSLGG